MKEFLYNIVFLPLPIFWLLILLLLFKNKINVIKSLKIIIIIFYILLTPIFSFLLEYPLAKGINKYQIGDKVSFVLVPTAGIFIDAKSNWHPSSETLIRVKRAELIAEKLKVPLLVSGGSVNSHNIAESTIVKNIITYENTFYEIESKNSYETAFNLKKAILKNKLNQELPVLLVTSALHNLRMALVLKSQGHLIKTYENNYKLNISISMFLPDSRAMSNKVIYEYLAIIKYIFMKFIIIK